MPPFYFYSPVQGLSDGIGLRAAFSFAGKPGERRSELLYNFSGGFSAAATIEGTHDLLASSLQLPGYYGRNADALWDCLVGGIGLPAMIEVRGRRQMRSVDGGLLLCAVLDEAHQAIDGITVVWVDEPVRP
ncbi:RNAse (barnase) inhibitor barstar [Tahibacter aquaticus]|uniref:RNAse (Barnase) inhibitor barstar n=2 Tax=Tahibacter aquaticus TaxID=520092 RepID=A0A4R6YSJ2_9GAMM|nr:RNAse (barnase) inhibitor barstar [Tahibacter aquaticus]